MSIRTLPDKDPEMQALLAAPPAVEVRLEVDAGAHTVRRVSGSIDWPGELPAAPTGFQRAQAEQALSGDGRRLAFRFTDVEVIAYPVPAAG